MPAALQHLASSERPPMRLSSGRLGGLATVAFVMSVGAGDASAAALSGAGSSMGLLVAIATWLLFKGWQTHLEFGGVPVLVGLLALAGGVALLYRVASPEFWKGGPARCDAVAASSMASGMAPVCLPASIDRDHLVADLSRHFIDLQAAWDLGSREALSRLTTPDMLEELWSASAAGIAAPGRTEVVSIEAQLLLFEERGAAQVVCVEFSGMVREVTSGVPSPFREFWMLTRRHDAPADWRLARHQALL